MKLVIDLRPFTFQKNYYIVNDIDQISDVKKTSLKNLNNVIFSQSFDQIILYGNATYVNHFVQKIRKEELEKYGQNTRSFIVKEV